MGTHNKQNSGKIAEQDGQIDAIVICNLPMNSNEVLKKTDASDISVEPVVMPRPNLTDDDLLKRCKDWITKLCDSGGKDWCLHVPVDLKRDPDMLFSELIRRYREKIL